LEPLRTHHAQRRLVQWFLDVEHQVEVSRACERQQLREGRHALVGVRAIRSTQPQGSDGGVG
jgi:hypothetical protein